MRVLVVDDEDLSRHLIKEYLTHHKDASVIGEAANGFEAVKMITDLRPDLVFLDIQMPKLTGFEVLELTGYDLPVIFTTAYDQFAIRAFEVNAIDYLLKPFSQERFDKALEKFRNRSAAVPSVEKLVADTKQKTPLERILIKEGSQVTIVAASKIDYFRAQDDYVEISSEGKTYLKQQTLSQLEFLLDAGKFARVHRSYIVNIEKIARVESATKDTKMLVLKNGSQIPVSRSGYERIKALL